MAGDTNTITQLNMGYGGFCGVEWYTDSLVKKTHTAVATVPNLSSPEQIFITNGNIGVTYNRPTENTYKAPRSTTNVMPILLSPGTASISGSVSFDMSHANLEYFLNQARLSRNTYFHLAMSTGSDYYVVYYNMWNSFSISASSGGLVTCNIGFISLNCFKTDITATSGFSAGMLTNIFDNALVAYWQAGTQGYVQSFTINITQDVTPVYLNNDLIMPSYLRSGSLKVNANIQSCISWQNIGKVIDLSTYTGTENNNNNDGNGNNSEDSGSTTGSGKFAFGIGSKTFTLNNALLSSQQYSHNGAGDVQKFSYSIQSVGLSSPNDSPFTITPTS